MQELIPAGWTFPIVYGEERFASLAELGNRILSHATHPVSQLFSTIITSLRTQLGIPSMSDVIEAINTNIGNFVRTNPRLAPVRAYYHAVLSIFNGDGNLWEDLQSISTITAFNQYYHIYAGVFVAFFVALRNTVTITGYVVRGIVNVGTDAVSFAIGEDLYNDIVRQVGDTTRNIVRLPVTGVYYTVRFVIHRVNSVVNIVARALIPDTQFDLFGGDPQEIPDNLIVGEGNYTLLDADSSVEYDRFDYIANFLELYVVNAVQFDSLVEMMSDPNLAQHFSNALQEVLVPPQTSDSQSSEMTVDTTTSSRASSVSATYGSNPALIARFVRNVISVFFTASAVAVIGDPDVENPAVHLIEDLTNNLSQGASQDTQTGIERIENVIVPRIEYITEQVEERIDPPPVFQDDNMNVVSSAESSQDSNFSANEAVDVISNLPNSTRLGGRKRKSRAKKQKGGKRRKTMKKSKKSKLRKPKTLKRRKSHRRRKTRKM